MVSVNPVAGVGGGVIGMDVTFGLFWMVGVAVRVSGA